MKHLLKLTLLLVIAAWSISCATKGQSTLSQAALTPTVTPNAAVKTAKKVYLCGAPTKAGHTCRRHVKAAGLHCYQHQSKG